MIARIPLLLAVVLLAAVGALTATEKDAFYKPDEGWQAKRPGEILRMREVKPVAFDLSGMKVKAYQLLYRTSGTSPSEPSHTVTTVIIPPKPAKDQLVLQPPRENAASTNCAPSHMVTRPVHGITLLAIHSWAEFLKKGYTLTVPDFEGPSSAFGAGRLAGHMALDGVRATLAAGVAPLSNQSKVVGYGYSGGSQPVGWAASLQPKYAPELNVVGWALGGTLADLGALVLFQDGGPFAGYVLTNVMGLRAAYPQVAKWLRSRLTPKGEAMFEKARGLCASGIKRAFDGQKISTDENFRNGSMLFFEPAFVSAFRTLVMGAARDETPKAPVLMHHALHDETVPIAPAQRAAERWAEYGADVQFVTNRHRGASHKSEELGGLAGVVRFVGERFDGKPFPTGLTQRNSKRSVPVAHPR